MVQLTIPIAGWIFVLGCDSVFDALRQQHEILFAGLPYYALRLSKFRSQIVNALKLTLHDDTPPTGESAWGSLHV